MQAYTSTMSQFTRQPGAAGDTAEDKPQGKSRKAASAFRTISEVAKDLGVQQHVLRFWETKFSQIRPLKRGGGRRYYRPEDVVLLRRIHELLYSEGYTIKGVQKLLREQGKNAVLSAGQGEERPVADEGAMAIAPPALKSHRLNDSQKAILQSMLGELKALRDIVTQGAAE